MFTMTPEEKEKLYTVRWYVSNRWGVEDAQADVLDLLGELLGEGNGSEPPSPGPGQNLKYCPFAQTTGFLPARTRGSYSGGYPKGAVVHFTAGHRNGLKSGLDYQSQVGHLYFLIDEEGNIGQNFSLEHWGYHAGQSSYPGLSGGVSDELVGIEVQAGGKLTRKNGVWRTWFGKAVPDENVREVPARDNMEAGAYELYTPDQEEALSNLILWLYHNNSDEFSLDFVVGHDEVSPGRKNDPGGALSMTMPEFRAHLANISVTWARAAEEASGNSIEEEKKKSGKKKGGKKKGKKTKQC